MRVLILQPGPDNGGVGAGIKRAFDHHAPEVEVRNVVEREAWYGWQTDIVRPRQQRLVAQLFARADVIHMMDRPSVVERYPGWERKPRVMHHHGEPFLVNRRAFMERLRQEGVPSYGATFRLLGLEPSLRWLPHPVDIEDLARIPRRPPKRLTIAQSPSARAVNDTAALIAAFAGLPAELHLIERMPWRAHLEAKARTSAVFDALTSGYGMTIPEGWGLGLPGIAGMDDAPTMARMCAEIGRVPYFGVRAATLNEDLRRFIEDPEARREATEAGLETLMAFHDERRIVERYRVAWEEALG